MKIHDIYVYDDMIWKNVVHETDEWFKIQYEILKKMPRENFPSELDYDGLMDYLEGLVKQNQEIVEGKIIRLVSDIFLVVSGEEPLHFREGEIIDDLTDIYETLERDPKLIDVLNLEELVELGRKDALRLGAKCEGISFKLSFKLLVDPAIMPGTLIKETTGVDVDYEDFIPDETTAEERYEGLNIGKRTGLALSTYKILPMKLLLLPLSLKSLTKRLSPTSKARLLFLIAKLKRKKQASASGVLPFVTKPLKLTLAKTIY